MPTKPVTIWSTMDQMEAKIMKSRLDASGISCFLEEGLSGYDPLLTNATGWIKLNVVEKDVKTAKEILDIKEQ
jgi:hypothetical protein